MKAMSVRFEMFSINKHLSFFSHCPPVIVKNVTYITYYIPYIFLWLDQNQSKLNDI